MRMHCCRSRLGGRRLVFQPYNREQLKDIVLSRLADAGATAAFNPRAIEYAARKVPQAALREVAVEKRHQKRCKGFGPGDYHSPQYSK